MTILIRTITKYLFLQIQNSSEFQLVQACKQIVEVAGTKQRNTFKQVAHMTQISTASSLLVRLIMISFRSIQMSILCQKPTKQASTCATIGIGNQQVKQRSSSMNVLQIRFHFLKPSYLILTLPTVIICHRKTKYGYSGKKRLVIRLITVIQMFMKLSSARSLTDLVFPKQNIILLQIAKQN